MTRAPVRVPNLPWASCGFTLFWLKQVELICQRCHRHPKPAKNVWVEILFLREGGAA